MKTTTYFARKFVQEVNKKVKRIFWTNEEIDKWFGKRSAEEIIKNGTTCFMNSCLDLTLVTASIISLNEISYTFVIEEHLPTKNFDFNRLHFVLELEFPKNKYTLNYKRCDEVYIHEGDYKGREDIPLAQIIRIDGNKIKTNKPLYKSLGYKNLEDLFVKQFKGYSLEKNLARLKKDNSKKNYNLFKNRYGNRLKLIEL